MWNVDTVIKDVGSGPYYPSQIESGYQHISDDPGFILDAAFSPDGTALATASTNGDVRFFQVCIQEKTPPR